MSVKKVAILDGCGALDQDLAPILTILSDMLRQDHFQIETFPLREINMAHCVGCFSCWLKTPGICAEDDAGREIAKALIQSDAAVLFTPVTFGGYSPELKKMVDRFIPLASPYFEVQHDEVHHPPRYTRRPRLMMVGVQRQSNEHEARVFKTLAGRNAINFHPPSYAAEVVAVAGSADELRKLFQEMLTRSDSLPYGQAAVSLTPEQNDSSVIPDVTGARWASLIVGSPQPAISSTSSNLGRYLLDRLHGRGWVTESVSLRANLNREYGNAELLESVDRAGLIILSSPLYVDSLPFLVTKAMKLIATSQRNPQRGLPPRFVAIVNSGFPERHQSAVAIEICREFAARSGLVWAGSLVLGGGGIVGGERLTNRKRSGPSVTHIARALDLCAEALDAGRPVPAKAAELMAKTPVPYIPFTLWRWLYVHFGTKGFDALAAKNGVSKERMLDQPYKA